MIVRIATEGQYRLPDESLARLDELDDAIAAAIEVGDEDAFARDSAALLEKVRGRRGLG